MNISYQRHRNDQSTVMIGGHQMAEAPERRYGRVKALREMGDTPKTGVPDGSSRYKIGWLVRTDHFGRRRPLIPEHDSIHAQNRGFRIYRIAVSVAADQSVVLPFPILPHFSPGFRRASASTGLVSMWSGEQSRMLICSGPPECR